METMLSETYRLRVDGGDVLLFRHGADGTTSLLAVSEREWLRAVAAEGHYAPRDAAARRLFAEAFASTTRVGDQTT